MDVVPAVHALHNLLACMRPCTPDCHRHGAHSLTVGGAQQHSAPTRTKVKKARFQRCLLAKDVRHSVQHSCSKG